jgi:hypothetical protein
MDMARKFLQMGYTRARRYARHRSGRKYGADGTELALAPDVHKQRSADEFRSVWRKVSADPAYRASKRSWIMATAKRKRTIARLPKKTRTALGKQGAKVAKQKRKKKLL